MMNFLTLLFSLFFTVQIFASGLDFTLLPSKSIKPGEVAIQVLPVKSAVDANYLIATKSSLGYNVEAPESVQIKANTAQYLTFITHVPARAHAGLMHELTITFVDTSNNQTLEHKLAFTIADNSQIDFMIPDEDLVSYTQSKIIPLKIANNGNREETFEIELQNYTPAVETMINKRSLRIAAGKSELVQVQLRFKHKASHYSSFEVRAKVGGVEKFKRRFLVRFISSGQSGNDQDGYYLDTQLVISNDFMSIEGAKSNISSAYYSANGQLSDYVSLSSYVQAQMFDGQNTEVTDMRFDFEGENWFVHLGSDVSVTPNQNIGNVNVDGVAAGYDFANGFHVGTMIGVAEETDHVHTAGIVRYDFTPNQRTFVLVDQNQDTGDTFAAAGYDARFQINEKLSFAPSLTVSDSPEQGLKINYVQTLKYMARDNLPIVLTTSYDNSDVRESLSNEIEATYIHKNLIYRVGTRLDVSKDKGIGTSTSTQSGETQVAREHYASITAPINDQVTGQVQYRYVETPEIKEHRPEVMISYAKGRFVGRVRAGLVNREDLREQDNDNAVATDGWAQIYELDLSYRLQKILLRSRIYYEELAASNYRAGAEVAGYYYLNHEYLKTLYLKLGHRIDQFDLEETRTNYVEAGATIHKGENTTFEIVGNVQKSDNLDDPEWFIGARLTIRDRVKVPRRISDAFGGSRTGKVVGKICLDANRDGKCQEGEAGVPGIRVQLEGLQSASDENGVYTFHKVNPGTVSIDVDKSFLGKRNLAADVTNQMLIVERNQEYQVEFAVYPISTVKSFAFFDRNGDGVYQKELESELNGVTFQLLQNNKVLKEVIFKGKYPIAFNLLPPGEYQMQANLDKENFIATTPQMINLQLPLNDNKLCVFGYTVEASNEEPDRSWQEYLLLEIEGPIIAPPAYQAVINLEFDSNHIQSASIHQILLNADEIDYEVENDSPTSRKIKVAVHRNAPQQSSLTIILKVTLSDGKIEEFKKVIKIIKI